MPPHFTYSTFKGVTQYGAAHITETTEANLIQFLNWAFLSIGGYRNVTIPTTQGVGGSGHVLKPVQDPNFVDGRVWQSNRKNWVWESGVEYAGTQPIQISGVYVNGVFKSPTTSGYQHYVDYPRGQVVFNTAIPTGSIVTLNYSYKMVNVIGMDEVTTYNMQFNSTNYGDAHYDQIGSGNYNRLADQRVQFPLIVVQSIDRRDFEGLMLGGGLVINTDVLFHVFAETEAECNNIADILSTQDDRYLVFFDVYRIAQSGLFPLDYRGAKVSNPRMYPQFANADSGFYYNAAFWHDTSVQGHRRVREDLFNTIIRCTFELRVPNL